METLTRSPCPVLHNIIGPSSGICCVRRVNGRWDMATGCVRKCRGHRLLTVQAGAQDRGTRVH